MRIRTVTMQQFLWNFFTQKLFRTIRKIFSTVFCCCCCWLMLLLFFGVVGAFFAIVFLQIIRMLWREYSSHLIYPISSVSLTLSGSVFVSVSTSTPKWGFAENHWSDSYYFDFHENEMRMILICKAKRVVPIKNCSIRNCLMVWIEDPHP